MKYTLLKEHWLKSKQDNINLILQSQMQIEMAKRIIGLVEEKLAEFPPDKTLELPPPKEKV